MINWFAKSGLLILLFFRSNKLFLGLFSLNIIDLCYFLVQINFILKNNSHRHLSLSQYMSIKRKFLYLILSVSVVLIAQSVFLLMVTSSVSHEVKDVAKVVTPASEEAYKFQFNVVQVQQWLTDISATRGLDGLNDGFDVADEHFKAANQNLIKLASLGTISSEQQQRAKKDLEVYYELGKKMANTYVAQGPVSGNQLMAQFDSAASSINKQVEVILSERVQSLRATDQRVSAELDTVMTVVITSALFNLLLLATIIAVVFFAVLRPLERVGATLHRLATGKIDLTQKIESQTNDEFNDILQSINQFVGKISNVIGQLTRSAITLESISHTLIKNAGDSMNNSLAQESDTNQIAGALTELFAAVSQINDNTDHAKTELESSASFLQGGFNELQHAVKEVERLNENISQAASSIGSLQHRTNEIEKVLDVISAIADQTNLLALNAAIEAARAGEQGRGFAVVADEVRALASRTQTSTTEINDIISLLQSVVKDSITHMEKCESSSRVAVAEVMEVLNKIQQVSRSVKQISDGTSNISVAILQQKTVISKQVEKTQSIKDKAASTTKSVSNVQHSGDEVLQLSHQLVELGQSLNRGR
jgi:methyl-accepting chemotaxis protein